MPQALPKQYDASSHEDEIYRRWETSGFFNPDNQPNVDESKPPFTIVLPPPNVTGTLHMGHAAMLAIEDTMVRFARMRGRRTLWIPGTDHAAVATEAKVEKILMDEGMDRPKQSLGREAFLARVNAFAQQSHDTIINQTKKMGCSLDWSREAYTLDATRNRLVNIVFKKMYEDGLIYRGYRVVNWSVRGQSTCSDDELEYVERPGKLYTFRYDADFPITIATTRPETKLGDTAVAVHPSGKWKEHIGKTYRARNVGGSGRDLEIKVIGREEVDDSYGTGALGVTPAHSPVDFDIYMDLRKTDQAIDIIQVIGEDGRIMGDIGEVYAGLSVKEARERFVEYLETTGLLEKEEDVIQNVGTSDRFKDIVEPLPKTQWFVDVNKRFTFEKSGISGVAHGDDVTLKELMLKVVDTSQVKILPIRFEKIYFHWIENLRDWNISRQIWFGHRVPVYYCQSDQCDGLLVSVDPPERCTDCGGTALEQDPDTLDTWFSSGMWTFSTLLDRDIRVDESLSDWLSRSTDFQRFHPTQVLETGYDIIFFWVARMILMTTYTLGTIPFETVYLHGLVRDEKGRKMSKSLGNIIDPLDMIEKYGTDATRLSLLIGGTPGNDVRLSDEKVEGYRNFTTKLWNIARFIQLSVGGSLMTQNSWPSARTLADRWILAEYADVVTRVTEHLERYELSAAGDLLRDFTWNELADWYLEIAKVEGEKDEILSYLFENILKLWHPFMPYVTEVLYGELFSGNMLLVESWPTAEKTNGVEDFDVLRHIISEIRRLRSEHKISPATSLNMYSSDSALVRENETVIKTLGRVDTIYYEKPVSEVTKFSVGGIDLAVDLPSVIDKDAELARLEKEIRKVAPYIMEIEKKLSNTTFLDNAPAAVVAKEREKLRQAKTTLAHLEEQRNNLA